VHQAPGFVVSRISGVTRTLLLAVLGLALLAGCADDPGPSLGFSDDSAAGFAGPGTRMSTTPAEMTPQGAPQDGATTTVRRLFAVPVTGEQVVLRGQVVQVVARHTFVLDDGTGAITVEGDERCGPFDVGDEVVVTGRVDVSESPFNVKIEASKADAR